MAKSKQTLIPGSDADIVAEIEKRAAEYQEAKVARMQCTEAESATKQLLHSAMEAAGLRSYRTKTCTPALDVEIKVTEETVKTTIVKEPAPGVVEISDRGGAVVVEGEHVEH